MNETASGLVAGGYDAFYARLRDSPTLRRIWREHVLGADDPEAFEHISFLTRPEVARMGRRAWPPPRREARRFWLRRGGPGLWIARDSGARLIGIDIAAVGIAHASRRAAELELSATARFVVASFEHTGLGSQSADGVMSADALQYAPNERAAFSEAARILRPGGRLAFTPFELEPARVAGLRVLVADPVADYRPLLEEAGFAVRVYEETGGWRSRVTNAYEAISDALDALREEMGPAASKALASEVSLTFQRHPYRRRIFAGAVRLSDA